MQTMTILLCLAGTAPADCTPAKALDVIPHQATQIECAMPWQTMPDLVQLRAQGFVVVIGRCR